MYSANIVLIVSYRLIIQSIYNIADSFFVARYSIEGLTALSIVYPIQLLITALATGTGAGVNILISRLDGRGETKTQHDIIKSGLFLNMFHFMGLNAVWWTFPVTEVIASMTGILIIVSLCKQDSMNSFI